MTLLPRQSGKSIAELSTHVTVKQEGIQKLGDAVAKEIEEGRLSTANFSQIEVHPKADDPFALDWLFLVDTLNFCFWSLDQESKWTVDGYTGYFALCAAINRAVKENPLILHPKYYSTITENDLKNILRGDNKVEVPLLRERVKCLHEAGAVLQEKFDGSFKNCVLQAENSAAKLLTIIVTNFKCFKDEADYKGQRVALYKRAQILIGDIWACFKNQGLGYFGDIDEITMFADYRIPQSLLFFGVFEYSNELTEKLRKNTILKNGDEEEVEIRGCSIHAVELVRDYVAEKLGKGAVNSILIDHFLWDFRRKYNEEIEKKNLYFHKTFCVYY